MDKLTCTYEKMDATQYNVIQIGPALPNPTPPTPTTNSLTLTPRHPAPYAAVDRDVGVVPHDEAEPLGHSQVLWRHEKAGVAALFGGGVGGGGCGGGCGCGVGGGGIDGVGVLVVGWVDCMHADIEGKKRKSTIAVCI